MNTRAAMSLGLSALVLGGSMVGCTMNRAQSRLAMAGAGVAGPADKAAAREAARAERALAKGQNDAAVAAAEAAVGLMPRAAGYRALLGQSYLQAGRFVAAREALAEALTLAPDDSRIALNLALAQTASGDWGAARATLQDHPGISATDRGLALALAGDPASGVEVLTAAARQPDATAKTRQNLALALALSGQWGMAKVVAAADMSPADVDRRMIEWASFAQPTAASDQVASLLGTVAVEDEGRPAALALHAPAPVAPQVAEAAPVRVAEVAAGEPEAPAMPVPALLARGSDEPAAAAATTRGAVRFAAYREVVQALPARVPTLLAPIRTAKAAAGRHLRPAAKGSWHVQLGAFDNAGVAHDAWKRAQRRFAAFGGHLPQAMNFAHGGTNFYRLSVGGFERADADRLCRSYRAQGGACFVRLGAGDQVAQWARRPGVMLASR